MLVPVTALYAALLVVILVALLVPIGSLRGKTGISILHGDDMDLATAMRRHGNFIEHVPIMLVLMAIIELNDGNAIFLHVAGILLVIFRILHPIGLHHDQVRSLPRFIGAAGTFLLTIVLGLMALWQGASAMLG